MRLLLAILLLLFAGTCTAQTYIVLTLRSYHFHREHKHNEANTGIGIGRKIDETHAEALGCYNNSYYRTSCYGIRIHQPWRFDHWKLGYSYGVVTGYDRALDLWLTGMVSRRVANRWHVDVIVNPAVVAADLRWEWR